MRSKNAAKLSLFGTLCGLFLLCGGASIKATATRGRVNSIDTRHHQVQNPHIGMIKVPAGTLMFGISRPAKNRKGYETTREPFPVAEFFIGKTEVTQAQWVAVMGENPSNHKNCDDCPVEKVSWDDIQVFIAKLNELNDGFRYRLPTIMEWEFAARPEFPDTIAFLDAVWCGDNSGSKTHPVGQKKANKLGLFDTIGNVQEWCQNWYDDPIGERNQPSERKMRSVRGGTFGIEVRYLIGTLGVMEFEPNYRGYSIGFRLAANKATDPN